MMYQQYMITTIDNPFNPFEEFESWFLFDVGQGYNTCSYLARVTNFDNSMSELEEIKENERAIDEIIMSDPFNIYRKITKEGLIDVAS